MCARARFVAGGGNRRKSGRGERGGWLGSMARGDAMPALIQAVGVWYFAALGAVFLVAALKHASAPRSPEEDQARTPLDALHWFVALMGWSVLVLHGVFVGLSRGVPV